MSSCIDVFPLLLISMWSGRPSALYFSLMNRYVEWYRTVIWKEQPTRLCSLRVRTFTSCCLRHQSIKTFLVSIKSSCRKRGWCWVIYLKCMPCGCQISLKEIRLSRWHSGGNGLMLGAALLLVEMLLDVFSLVCCLACWWLTNGGT